jgi:hypothetical protein
MRIILLLHGAPGKSRFLSRPQVLSWPIKVLRNSNLTKSGHYTQTPPAQVNECDRDLSPVESIGRHLWLGLVLDLRPAIVS